MITSPAEDCIGLGKNRGSYKNHPFYIKQVRERRLSICAGTVEWVTQLGKVTTHSAMYLHVAGRTDCCLLQPWPDRPRRLHRMVMFVMLIPARRRTHRLNINQIASLLKRNIDLDAILALIYYHLYTSPASIPHHPPMSPSPPTKPLNETLRTTLLHTRHLKRLLMELWENIEWIEKQLDESVDVLSQRGQTENATTTEQVEDIPEPMASPGAKGTEMDFPGLV